MAWEWTQTLGRDGDLVKTHLVVGDANSEVVQSIDRNALGPSRARSYNLLPLFRLERLRVRHYNQVMFRRRNIPYEISLYLRLISWGYYALSVLLRAFVSIAVVIFLWKACDLKLDPASTVAVLGRLLAELASGIAFTTVLLAFPVFLFSCLTFLNILWPGSPGVSFRTRLIAFFTVFVSFLVYPFLLPLVSLAYDLKTPSCQHFRNAVLSLALLALVTLLLMTNAGTLGSTAASLLLAMTGILMILPLGVCGRSIREVSRSFSASLSSLPS